MSNVCKELFIYNASIKYLKPSVPILLSSFKILLTEVNKINRKLLPRSNLCNEWFICKASLRYLHPVTPI